MSSPPRKKGRKAKQPNDSNYGIIRLEVDKVSSLDERGRFFPDVEVGGVPWRVRVDKSTSNNEQVLTLNLSCLHHQLTPWSMEMSIGHAIINSDNSKSEIVNDKYSIDHYVATVGSEMMLWQELIDAEKGFIKNDKITIEIRLIITYMWEIKFCPRIDFTDPNEPSHDVTLMIEGEKIYASKSILAVHSQYFKAMFYGNFDETNKKEIELKNVDRKEFLDMIKMIYPSSKKVLTDSSVEYLLKLGDQFQVDCMTELAEYHLRDSDTISRMEKLRIADKYRSGKLLHWFLIDFWKAEHFKDIQESYFYSDLSAETMRALYERMVGVMNYKYTPYDPDDDDDI